MNRLTVSNGTVVGLPGKPSIKCTDVYDISFECLRLTRPQGRRKLNMHPSPETQGDSPRYYRVASVEQAAAPPGAEGNNWCRYALESKHSTLTGWRQGSLREITQYATQYAEELNARSQDGASPSAYRRKR